METMQGNAETGLLTPLFEAKAQNQTDMEAVVSAETREGELIASGDGRVSGALLNGTVRWSTYAGNCAYVFVRAGLEPPPGQHLCTVHPAGMITTDDGAQILFDGRGYGLRGADQWLNSTLGVLVSEFDERAGRALWHAFVPAVEGSAHPRGRVL